MQMRPNPAGPRGVRPFSAPGAARPFKCRRAGPDRLPGWGTERGMGRGCGGALASGGGTPRSTSPQRLSSLALSLPPTFTVFSDCLSYRQGRYAPGSPEFILEPQPKSKSASLVRWNPRWNRNGTRSLLALSRRRGPRSALPAVAQPGGDRGAG